MKIIEQRSGGTCEFCMSIPAEKFVSANDLTVELNNAIHICNECDTATRNPLENKNLLVGLNSAVWSEHAAVRVLAYRVLVKVESELEWTFGLKESIAKDVDFERLLDTEITQILHIDSIGNVLQTGDSVLLIKDLDVKGSSITAKRGTVVKNIRLDPDNSNYIEGKVDGQMIVILTQYVKKS